ncbi:hypothetical protein UFOVP1204_43 [uncultured Caudovirales phage]|uniref:Uncharacterized protein n=1 Tax=uncultured Caudovirales phage TaxID=2100421 RepID=A0A6J5QZM9_9CAUD|nr:hypothetical protein UFOVP473_58 [uncultured Caudovirales phage]CAB4176820.1 hypothetical protein UFOVP983_58 [uncultured Caudovirales phage]CAB4190089.1 hypothetical protein UFOVP1204_43 [uncultured Caudovirales phage]
MKRRLLDMEITRLESIAATTIERFGERSKENIARVTKLRDLKIERMRRDLNIRKTKKFRRAA